MPLPTEKKKMAMSQSHRFYPIIKDTRKNVYRFGVTYGSSLEYGNLVSWLLLVGNKEITHLSNAEILFKLGR